MDVRGMTADKPFWKWSSFWTCAFRMRLPSVVIIHGKGTGVLRQAVPISRRPMWKSFRLGAYGQEGETGVTIVQLSI